MLTSTLLAATLMSGAPTAPAADAFALKAASVHVGDGTTIENGVVVVENGKIKSVGQGAPEGVRLIEVDGHLTPGLIAMRDATGTGGERSETTRKFTPNADMARAFDPDHPAWKKVVEQGITTVLLTPGPSQIAGGACAAVSPGTGEVVERGAAVALGMSSRVFTFGVEPTSYAGLFGHLERLFAEAAADSPLGRAKAGQVPVLMEATSRSEALRAIEFAGKHGLSGAIVGLQRGEEIVDEIKEAGLAVVLESIGAGAAPSRLDAAQAFAEKGVPFAFTADSERRGPASLRMTAATYIRRGLAPAAALTAMTAGAAGIAGVDDRGTLAAGKVADLVVWSGNPTDLTSRVQHVFAGGEHVHDATQESAR